FMPASWNSYSKSDTARRPRSTTRAPCLRTNSVSRPLKPSTCTFFRSPSTSRAMAMRSSSVKYGFFALLSAMARMMESNSGAARRTRSSWPRVSGSNVPGYTALIIASPFEELVAHLPGARLLEFAPAAAGFTGCRRLDVDTRRSRKARLEALEHRWQRILPERRIEENHVEALLCLPEIAQRVAANQLDGASADLRARCLQRGAGGTVAFHHDDARGAARRRLEAKRAAAGEKIEATLAVEPLSEPVEERLAHAVGRRSQAGTRGHRDAPAAILAGDDADFPCSFALFVTCRMH